MRKPILIIAALLVTVVTAGGLVYFTGPHAMRQIMNLPPFTAEAGATQSIQVAMRDGIKLQTYLFFPKGDGPWPTVLLRDPYGFARKVSCPLLVHYGYACVHQDVRGRFGSEGQWTPLVNERHDGIDSLNWLVEQPWQNANIALYGPSYLGLVQWAIADKLPPEVKTIVAEVSHGDFYDILYRRGNFIHGIMSFWALSLHGDEGDLETLARQRPALENARRFLEGEQNWYTEYMAHADKAEKYWQAGIFEAMRESAAQVEIPVLMMGGWHDFFIEGQFQDFATLPTLNSSLFTVRHGGHTWLSGAGDLGLSRLAIGRFELNTQLQWLGHHLKGENSVPVKTGYLLQDNRSGAIEHYPTWPPAVIQKPLFLADLAASPLCDGGLLREIPSTNEQGVGYRYDPQNPVPTRGGSRILSPYQRNVVDQKSDLCERNDVLSFRSEVFPEGLHISGTIEVRLQVSSSAPDTAFTAKLQEKKADGAVLNIRDDIVSLRYRESDDVPRAYEAGTEVDVRISMMPIDWRLEPGSSLRLDISSSNFPTFTAHLNSATPWHRVDHPTVAQQTLYGGSLVLPLREANDRRNETTTGF